MNPLRRNNDESLEIELISIAIERSLASCNRPSTSILSQNCESSNQHPSAPIVSVNRSRVQYQNNTSRYRTNLVNSRPNQIDNNQNNRNQYSQQQSTSRQSDSDNRFNSNTNTTYMHSRVRIYSNQRNVSTTRTNLNYTNQTAQKRDNRHQENNSQASKDESDTHNLSLTKACVICLINPKVYACVPCGHRCICQLCHSKARHNITKCPVCRRKFTQLLRIFE